MEPRPGRQYIGLYNDNTLQGISVNVKITAMVVLNKFETRTVTTPIIKNKLAITASQYLRLLIEATSLGVIPAIVYAFIPERCMPSAADSMTWLTVRPSPGN